MIDLFFEIIKHPLTYSCAPVILFGIGYYIKSWINKHTNRQTLLYELISLRSLFKHNNQISLSQLSFLKDKINSIFMNFDMTDNLISHTNALSEFFKYAPATTETFSPIFDLVILELSKQSWKGFNKFKSTSELNNILSYHPNRLIEYENRVEFGIKDIMTVVQANMNIHKLSNEQINMFNNITIDPNLLQDYINFKAWKMQQTSP